MLQIAEAKSERLKASVPKEIRSKFDANFIINLLRLTDVIQVGPAIALNIVSKAGLLDIESRYIQDAAVQNYIKALYEQKIIEQHMQAEKIKTGHIYEMFGRRVGERLNSIKNISGAVNTQQGKVNDDIRGMKDLMDLTIRLNQERSDLLLEQRKYSSSYKEEFKYVTAHSEVEPPRRIMGPFDLISVPYQFISSLPGRLINRIVDRAQGRVSAKDQLEKMEEQEEFREQQPQTFENLDELYRNAIQYSPLIKQFDASRAYTENLIKALERSWLPKIGYSTRYFSSVDFEGLEPQEFEDLFEQDLDKFSLGLHIDMEFDFSKRIKFIQKQKELESIDLNNREVASWAYMALAEKTNELITLRESMDRIDEEIFNIEKQIGQKKEFSKYNIDTHPQEAKLVQKHRNLEAELDTSILRIELLGNEIRQVASLYKNDELIIPEDYTTDDIIKEIKIWRYRHLIAGEVSSALGSLYRDASAIKEQIMELPDGLITRNKTDIQRLISYINLIEGAADRKGADPADKINEIQKYFSKIGSYLDNMPGLRRSDAGSEILKRYNSMIDVLNARDEYNEEEIVFNIVGEKLVKNLSNDCGNIANELIELYQEIKELPEFCQKQNIELIQMMKDLLPIIQETVEEDMDPADKLNRLSELVCKFNTAFVSLNPELKWFTESGLKLEQRITFWDKSIMGRYDPYTMHRIALKTAEDSQLSAIIKNRMEPFKLQLNLLAGLEGVKKGEPITKENIALSLIPSFSIPPKFIEKTIGRPFIRLYSRLDPDKTPFLRGFLREFTPGVKSYEARSEQFQMDVKMSEFGFVKAQDQEARVEIAKKAAVEQYAKANEYYNLMLSRVNEALEPLPAAPTLEEKEQYSVSEEVYLGYQKGLSEATGELFVSEISLRRLGINPENIDLNELMSHEVNWGIENSELNDIIGLLKEVNESISFNGEKLEKILEYTKEIREISEDNSTATAQKYKKYEEVLVRFRNSFDALDYPFKESAEGIIVRKYLDFLGKTIADEDRLGFSIVAEELNNLEESLNKISEDVNINEEKIESLIKYIVEMKLITKDKNIEISDKFKKYKSRLDEFSKAFNKLPAVFAESKAGISLQQYITDIRADLFGDPSKLRGKERELIEQSFEVRISELKKEIEEAHLRVLKASGGLSGNIGFNLGLTFTPFKGGDRLRVAPGADMRMAFFDEGSVTPFDVRSQALTVEGAEYGVQQAEIDVEEKLGTIYCRFLENAIKADMYSTMLDAQAADLLDLANTKFNLPEQRTAQMLVDGFAKEAIKNKQELSRVIREMTELIGNVNTRIILKSLPSSELVTSCINGTLEDIIMKEADTEGHPKLKEVQAQRKAEEMKLASERFKNFIPDVFVDVNWNDFMNNIEVWLGASMNFTPASIFKSKMMKAEIEKKKIFEEQIQYDLEARVATEQSRLMEYCKILERTDSSIQELTERMNDTFVKYQQGRIQAGDVSGQISQLARLMGVRVSYMSRVANSYKMLSRVVELPPLDEVFEFESSPDNLLTELNKIELQVDERAPPVAWQDILFLKPDKWNKVPLDEPVPLRCVLKLPSVVEGDFIEISGKHQEYDGPDWLREDVAELLDQTSIGATDEHMLNIDEWAITFHKVFETYKISDEKAVEMMKLINRIAPDIFERTQDLTDPDDMNNFMSIFFDPVFQETYPYYYELLFEPFTGLPADRNLLKKLELSLMYALEIYGDQTKMKRMMSEWEVNDWLTKRLDRDIGLIKIGASERQNKKVSKENFETYVSWLASRSTTQDRLVVIQHITPEKWDEYIDAAHKSIHRMFPSIAFLDDMSRGVRGEVAKFGDLSLEGIYRSLLSNAMSMGLEPEEMDSYMAVINMFLPPVKEFVEGSDVVPLSKLPESELLRLMIRELYEGDLDKDQKQKMQMQIHIESYKTSCKVTMATAMFWVKQFMRDMEIESVHDVINSPALHNELSDRFKDFMEKMVTLKDMPIANEIFGMQEQLSAFDAVNWLSSEAQGFLSSIVFDWMKEDWTEPEVKAHLENVKYVLENHIDDLKEYNKLINKTSDFDFTTRDILKLKREWGDITGQVMMIEKLNNKVALTEDEIEQTIRDLIIIQEESAKEGLDIEAGQDGYLYRLANNHVPEQPYELDTSVPHEQAMREFIQNIALAKNRFEIAGVNVENDLTAMRTNPGTIPKWLDKTDVENMIDVVAGNVSKGIPVGLKDRKVTLPQAVSLVVQYMPLRGYSGSDLIDETYNEIFLQSVYSIYHKDKNGIPKLLQQGDIAPYLKHIFLKASGRDDVGRIFKYDGLIQETVENEMQGFVEEDVEEIRKKLTSSDKAALKEILPEMSAEQRIGMASRIKELQDRNRLGESSDAVKKYVDDWMRDAAFIQSLNWHNSDEKYVLPWIIINASIENFREGSEQFSDGIEMAGIRHKIRSRFDTIFKLDPTYRDLGDADKNFLRLIRLVHYITFEETMDDNDEAWWLDKCDELANKMSGSPQIEIERVQQELVIRFMTLRQNLMEITGQRLYEAKGYVKSAALKREIRELEIKLSERIIDNLVGWPARQDEIDSIREKYLAEEEVVEPYQAILETERDKRQKDNEELMSTYEKLKNIRIKLARKAEAINAKLSSAELSFLIGKMMEIGYSEDEVILRFIDLPRRVKIIYERATGSIVDTEKERGLMSAFADPIFKKWGFIDAGHKSNIANGLSARPETSIASVDEGTKYELEQLEERFKLAMAINDIIVRREVEGRGGAVVIKNEFGIEYDNEDKRLSEVLRMAADAQASDLDVDDIKAWANVAKELKLSVKDLGIVAIADKKDFDREIFFRSDLLLKLGIAELYERPELTAAQEAQLRLSVNNELDWLFKVEIPESWPEKWLKFLPKSWTQKPSLERALLEKMAMLPNLQADILRNIGDSMIQRRMTPADFKLLLEKVNEKQDFIEPIRKAAEEQGMFEEAIGIITELSKLELLLYYDITQKDPAKRIGLVEIIFWNMDPKDISRLETKIKSSVDEAVKQIEKERIEEVSPMPYKKLWLWRKLIVPPTIVADSKNIFSWKTWSDTTLERLALVGFGFGLVNSLFKVATGFLRRPLKKVLTPEAFKRVDKNKLIRINVLLFEFLAIGWTMFLVSWNLMIFNPYGLAFNWVAALFFLAPTYYLLKIFPKLNLLQFIANPKAIISILAWTLGATTVKLGIGALATIVSSLLANPVFLVAITIQVILMITTSKWFADLIGMPYARMVYNGEFKKIKDSGLTNIDPTISLLEPDPKTGKKRELTDLQDLGERESNIVLSQWMVPEDPETQLEDYAMHVRDAIEKHVLLIRGNYDKKIFFPYLMNGPEWAKLHSGKKVAGMNEAEFMKFFLKIIKGTNKYVVDNNGGKPMPDLFEELAWTDENGNDHKGSERMPIMIVPPGRKPKLQASLAQFCKWGEDGTEGNAWGEAEFNYKVNKGIIKKEDYEPEIIEMGGRKYMFGVPHIVKERLKLPENQGIFNAMNSYYTEPMFWGAFSEDEDNPFIAWDQYKETKGFKDVFKPDQIGKSRVVHTIDVDDGNYMSPGSAVYMMNCMEKSRKAGEDFFMFQGSTGFVLPYDGLRAKTLYQFQGVTAHESLWFTQQGWAKMLGGLRAFGKYSLTVDGYCEMFSPVTTPGCPYGLYFSKVFMDSGLIPKRFDEQFGINGKNIKDGKQVINDQADINTFLFSFLMGTFNSEDEILSYTPEDVNELWAYVKAGMPKKWHKPLNHRALKSFMPFLVKLQNLDEPPLRNRPVALIERPDRVPMIIDDRPESPVLELYRLYKKWLVSFDAPQEILKHFGHSVARGLRGRILNSLVFRGLFSEPIFLFLQILGLSFTAFLFGYLEVFLVGAAWFLTITVLISLVHSKFTGPLCGRIEERYEMLGLKPGLKDNPPAKFIITLLFTPIDIVRSLLVDVPHGLNELLISNGILLAQLLMKLQVVCRIFIIDMGRLMRTGAGGRWLTVPSEFRSHPIWAFLLTYKAPFTIGLSILIIFSGTLGVPWITTFIVGLIASITLVVSHYMSAEYINLKAAPAEAKKSLEEAEKIAKDKGIKLGLKVYWASLKLKWAQYEMRMQTTTGVVPAIVIMSAVIFSFFLGSWISLHWIVLFSPLLVGFVAAPFIAHFVGLHIPNVKLLPQSFKTSKSSVARYMYKKAPTTLSALSWLIGATSLLVACITVLPGVQEFLGLEFLTKTYMPIASSILSGDGGAGVYAPILNVKTPFVFLHSLILTGELILFGLGLLSSIIHTPFWVIRWSMKKKGTASSATPSVKSVVRAIQGIPWFKKVFNWGTGHPGPYYEGDLEMIWKSVEDIITAKLRTTLRGMEIPEKEEEKLYVASETVSIKEYLRLITEAVAGLDMDELKDAENKGIKSIKLPLSLSEPAILETMEGKKIEIYLMLSNNPEVIQGKDQHMLGTITNGPPTGIKTELPAYTLTLQQASFILGMPQLRTVLKHEFNEIYSRSTGRSDDKAHEYALSKQTEAETSAVKDSIENVLVELIEGLIDKNIKRKDERFRSDIDPFIDGEIRNSILHNTVLINEMSPEQKRAIYAGIASGEIDMRLKFKEADLEEMAQLIREGREISEILSRPYYNDQRIMLDRMFNMRGEEAVADEVYRELFIKGGLLYGREFERNELQIIKDTIRAIVELGDAVSADTVIKIIGFINTFPKANDAVIRNFMVFRGTALDAITKKNGGELLLSDLNNDNMPNRIYELAVNADVEAMLRLSYSIPGLYINSLLSSVVLAASHRQDVWMHEILEQAGIITINQLMFKMNNKEKINGINKYRRRLILSWMNEVHIRPREGITEDVYRRLFEKGGLLYGRDLERSELQTIKDTIRAIVELGDNLRSETVIEILSNIKTRVKGVATGKYIYIENVVIENNFKLLRGSALRAQELKNEGTNPLEYFSDSGFMHTYMAGVEDVISRGMRNNIISLSDSAPSLNWNSSIDEIVFSNNHIQDNNIHRVLKQAGVLTIAQLVYKINNDERIPGIGRERHRIILTTMNELQIKIGINRGQLIRKVYADIFKEDGLLFGKVFTDEEKQLIKDTIRAIAELGEGINADTIKQILHFINVVPVSTYPTVAGFETIRGIAVHALNQKQNGVIPLIDLNDERLVETFLNLIAAMDQGAMRNLSENTPKIGMLIARGEMTGIDNIKLRLQDWAALYNEMFGSAVNLKKRFADIVVSWDEAVDILTWEKGADKETLITAVKSGWLPRGADGLSEPTRKGYREFFNNATTLRDRRLSEIPGLVTGLAGKELTKYRDALNLIISSDISMPNLMPVNLYEVLRTAQKKLYEGEKLSESGIIYIDRTVISEYPAHELALYLIRKAVEVHFVDNLKKELTPMVIDIIELTSVYAGLMHMGFEPDIEDGAIVDTLKDEMLPSLQILNTKPFTEDIGVAEIKIGDATAYHDGVLEINKMIYEKILSLLMMSEDKKMARDVIRTMLVLEKHKDKEEKEYYSAYMNELSAHMSEVQALALPLWFNTVFSGNINLSKDDMWEYVRGLLDSRVVMNNPKKAWMVVEEAVKYNEKLLGEERMVSGPKDAGYVAPGKAINLLDKALSGVKQILWIFNRFRRAMFGVPMVLTNSINPVAASRQFDGLFVQFVGEGGINMSMESIVISIIERLRGRKEQHISPKLNKFTILFSMT
ncbi:TolC family protein [Elusimicrobiota bacterium]